MNFLTGKLKSYCLYDFASCQLSGSGFVADHAGHTRGAGNVRYVSSRLTAGLPGCGSLISSRVVSERGFDANSNHWFTTSFLPGRKMPESDARSVGSTQTPSTGLRHPSFLGGRCRKAMLGVWVRCSHASFRSGCHIGLLLTGRMFCRSNLIPTLHYLIATDFCCHE